MCLWRRILDFVRNKTGDVSIAKTEGGVSNYCCAESNTIEYWAYSSECVCLYTYLFSMQSACAVLYCHLWHVRLYNFFFFHIVSLTALISGKKKVVEHEMCFGFSLQLSPRIYLIQRRNQRNFAINTHRSSGNVIRIRFEWNLNFLDQF
jgi:hypothetical protein